SASNTTLPKRRRGARRTRKSSRWPKIASLHWATLSVHERTQGKPQSMTYLIIAVLLGLLAVAICALALRLLLGSWLLQWLRGTAGLLVLAVAVLVALAAWDLRSYRSIVSDKPIATLAFAQLEDRHFAMTLVDQGGS